MTVVLEPSVSKKKLRILGLNAREVDHLQL